MTYDKQPKKFLSTKQALLIVQAFIKDAKEAGFSTAVCGGFAMQMYGSDRATSDIDFVADGLFSDRDVEHPLSFGGHRYIGAGEVRVDIIKRTDDQAEIYQESLRTAKLMTLDGVTFRVVRPEYLLIMKMAAGRSRDQSDVLFLLRQPKLIDRTKTKKIIKDLFGTAAFWPLKDFSAVCLEADLMSKRDADDVNA